MRVTLKGIELLAILGKQVAAQAAFGCQASGAAASSNLPQRGVLLQQHLWSARPWLSSSIRAFAASAKPVGAAQTAAQAAKKPAASPGSFSRWWQAFQQVPTVPKFLGLTGAIPFIALAPPVCKHLTSVLPAEVVDNCAMIQVCYGVTIVSFLGAVHWGVAMSSSLGMASAQAAQMANEAFIYSVLPSLAAWPVALMEPGAGSMVLAMLLPACYLADFARRNKGLPQWYMALRVPLTLAATFGMLLTATRHVHLEFDRAKQIADQAAASKAAADASAGK
ncbi:hypothetical protein OEZ85_012159 [Tetradesmus obliquus]|uniref:Protein TIC 20 n=1 Tax=Tetradesmus obliquus TaxID=3088 RepID=A0ABY8TSI6_TETOB|nr:hypothetical protein OEZ85_012159 [Tetradesmus obliquus]